MSDPSQPRPPPVTSTARSTGPLKSDPPIPAHDSTRPRTPQEAERFFRRVALENQPPSRTMRWLSIGGWVAGACKSIFSCSRERLILRIVVNRDPLGRDAFRRLGVCGLTMRSCGLTVRSRSFSCCILRYIIPYPIHIPSAHHPCICLHLSNATLQSLQVTWYSTQTLANANMSFHQ